MGINRVGYESMRRSLVKGLHNVALFAEARAQQSMGNAGGAIPHTPSAPGQPPEVQTGNLRRSMYAAALLDGSIISGGGPPDGGEIPDLGNDAMVAVTGTSAGYGGFLELGTRNMAARPFLTPAAHEAAARAPELIAAVAK